ncbi:GNAT family N-acetyltransferase [Epibacterium ulvae]|uniref:GNAT family N-acetyltransferase n=1 Tax=Epibacterium ulvae TaxID=1156985 RepID=UPI001BFC4D66|nr:GNAT family N-acetyltransferase [Epibacterium ulvae]MBT8154204.1 GNAT family N-acetyltransferase [Epibacterium ulvae]
MISLAPLERSQDHTVAHIAPFPDQILFVGTVEEIFREPPDRFDLHQILMETAPGETTPVGVFKIDRHYHISFPVAPAGEIGMRALIIDSRVQGKGVGTAAMRALAPYLAPLYPQASFVYLTVNFRNLGALSVYAKAGFENTGDTWPHGAAGPQAVMRHPLRSPTPAEPT